jgi:hypothetical protein
MSGKNISQKKSADFSKKFRRFLQKIPPIFEAADF